MNEQVGRINGMYGTVDCLPIHYIHRSLDIFELDALLSIADVGLITPLKGIFILSVYLYPNFLDGMNLIPFHFIASQKDNHGVLVLSEFAGSSFALKGSIIVNPWATDDIALAIKTAVTMSDEDRLTNHQHAYAYVSTHDSNRWASSYLSHLKEIDTEVDIYSTVSISYIQ